MSILLSRSFYVHPLKPPVPGREKDDKPENLPIIANKQISFGGKEHEKDLFFITGIPDFVNVSPKNHLQIMGRYVDVVS